MSRIINYDVSSECKTWNAPTLVMGKEVRSVFSKKNQQENSPEASLETLRQQAYEKGYTEGLAKGQQEINQKVRQMDSLLTAFVMPLANLDNLVVDEMVQLSMAVVKQMVRRELKISPGEVVAVVKEALSVLPSASAEITIELHPDDARIIRETLLTSEANTSWKINEDPLLSRGGCRVMTSASRIDATVENRINNIIAEVMGGERKVDNDN